MSYVAVPTKYAGQTWSHTDYNTYWKANINTGLWVPLDWEERSASAAASITLDASSTDFRSLLLWIVARGTTVATQVGLNLRMNADAGANYQWQETIAKGSTGAATSTREEFAQNEIRIGIVPAASATANTFGEVLVWLARYQGTSHYKIVRASSSIKIGTATEEIWVMSHMGVWRNTAAVTSLTVLPASDNLAQYTVAHLYGMPY